MNKRIFLILVFGVSFTPAVFASNGDRSIASYPPEHPYALGPVESRKAGEMNFSDMNPSSFRCEGNHLVNKGEENVRETTPANQNRSSDRGA